jgi:hypothetical protein
VRSVTCPDCGAQVEIPVVTVGDESVIVYCKNCLWKDLDSLYGRRGLVVFSGFEDDDLRHPYVFVQQSEASSLNAVLNSLTSGGTVWLEAGSYAAAGDITITQPNVTLQGVSLNSTYIPGSILINAPGQVKVQNLTCRGTGKAYAIKIAVSGGVARCELRNVWMGGSTLVAGDGAVKGLYLDGAIVTVIDHCTMAFNSGAGLYCNTSVAADSTNVNTFRGCTFNGNGTYGVHLEIGGDAIAGYMLHEFLGGNMEDNTLKDVYADGATFVKIAGVDFENSTHSYVGGENIFLNGCQPAVIEFNNFVLGGGITVTRFFQMTGCANGLVRHNRLSVGGGATYAQGAVGVFDDGCVQCSHYDNLLWPAGAGLFINNRGSMRGNVS